MFYDFYLNRPAGKLAEFQAKRLVPALAKPALNGLLKNPKILEVGVGRGDFAQYLKGTNYTGIEANKILCQRLNEQGFNVINCFVPPFPKQLEKESFDLVIMCHIFEHFMDWKEALKVLEEVRSLLKVGGRLLLFHPDFLDWGNDYFDGDYSHSLILTRKRVEGMVSDSGFKVIYRDSFRSFFHGIKPFSWLLSKFMNVLWGKPKIAFKLNLLTICEKK